MHHLLNYSAVTVTADVPVNPLSVLTFKLAVPAL